MDQRSLRIGAGKRAGSSGRGSPAPKGEGNNAAGGFLLIPLRGQCFCSPGRGWRPHQALRRQWVLLPRSVWSCKRTVSPLMRPFSPGQWGLPP